MRFETGGRGWVGVDHGCVVGVYMSSHHTPEGENRTSLTSALETVTFMPHILGMGKRKSDGLPEPVLPKGEYGPKMRALPNNRWRLFVLNLINQGSRNQAAAYKEAGFSPGTENAARVEAHRMAHDQRILDALHEEAQKALKSLVPLAIRVVGDIVDNGDAKDADRLTGIKTIFDRAGLHGIAETRVVHELADDTEMLAEIRMLAQRNGVPLESLLGGRLTKQIEGEFVDVTPGSDSDN
jgi:phage terminase small subunit